jgi:glycosyltransferase involved in cell wall biosynthesis
VLVSTPDVLTQAGAFREDASYLPNPVDTNVFHPKPLIAHEGKMRVLIASSAWIAKGTDIIIHALGELRDKVEASMINYGVDYAQMLALARSLNLQIKTLPKLTHEDVREYYWNADLILDQFRCGVVGNVFLEAVACGRPAIGYVSSEYPEYEKLPLKDIDSSEKMVKAIEDVKDLTDLWKTQYAYLKAEHDVNTIVKKTLKLYEELCSME